MTRAPRQLLTGWVANSRPNGCPEMTWGRTSKRALKCEGLPVNFKEWRAIAEDRAVRMEIADVLETYASFRGIILQGPWE